MPIKTFRARSVGEALAMVKRDMGGDAVILHTRTVKAGGLLGIGGHIITEITATDQHQPSATKANATRRDDQRRVSSTNDRRRTFDTGVNDDDARERLLALARSRGIGTAATTQRADATQGGGDTLSLSDQAQQSWSPARQPNDDRTRDRHADLAPPHVTLESGGEFDLDAIVETARRRRQEQLDAATRNDAPTSAASTFDQPAPRSNDAEQRPAPHTRSHEEDTLHAELDNLQKLVKQIISDQHARTAPDLPESLTDFYETLLESDVDAATAAELLRRVRDGLSREELEDPELVRRALLTTIAARVPTLRSLPKGGAQDDGRPLTIALLGPTGVGKTTTIAKIAAAYKLRFGHKVGLITCDTYRIAAVDQLRQYANIIGLPVEVAITPSDVEHACHMLRDCDVILIDTAGRSQRDADKITALNGLLNAASPHQRHLVLSSAASRRVLEQAVQSFAPAHPDHVIFSKLDEAVGLGPILRVCDQLGAVVSFVTTGQEVPDEIELARPERLAEYLLEGAGA